MRELASQLSCESLTAKSVPVYTTADTSLGDIPSVNPRGIKGCKNLSNIEHNPPQIHTGSWYCCPTRSCAEGRPLTSRSYGRRPTPADGPPSPTWSLRGSTIGPQPALISESERGGLSFKVVLKKSFSDKTVSFVCKYISFVSSVVCVQIQNILSISFKLSLPIEQ